jgi:hypothetical protein
MTSHFRLGTAVAVSALILSVGAASAQFNLRQAPGPQPGQCKTSAMVAHAPTQHLAQEMWSAMAAQAHGNNWAIYWAAADRATFPVGNQWRATGRPCYALPVP